MVGKPASFQVGETSIHFRQEVALARHIGPQSFLDQDRLLAASLPRKLVQFGNEAVINAGRYGLAHANNVCAVCEGLQGD